jgi:hypothetical protein
MRAKPVGERFGSIRLSARRIAAGVPWLTFYCPGCGQFGSVDLRTLDRHPGSAISSLIPSLSCRRCSPNAPFARLEMLTSGREVSSLGTIAADVVALSNAWRLGACCAVPLPLLCRQVADLHLGHSGTIFRQE